MINKLYFWGIALLIIVGISAVGLRYRDAVKEAELVIETQAATAKEYKDVRKKIDRAVSPSRTVDDARQRLLDRKASRNSDQ